MPGSAPGQQCLTCNSPAIVLITKMIADGQSDYKIAGAFGLPRQSVARHRRNRHAGVSAAASRRGPNLAAAKEPEKLQPLFDGDEGEAPDDAPDLPLDATPREQLEHLSRQLKLQAAEGDIRPDLARELRLTLETLQKMGGLEPPPVVRVRDVEGLLDLFADLHLVLERFPEARDAIGVVWAKHGLEDDDAVE